MSAYQIHESYESDPVQGPDAEGTWVFMVDGPEGVIAEYRSYQQAQNHVDALVPADRRVFGRRAS